MRDLALRTCDLLLRALDALAGLVEAVERRLLDRSPIQAEPAVLPTLDTGTLTAIDRILR